MIADAHRNRRYDLSTFHADSLETDGFDFLLLVLSTRR